MNRREAISTVTFLLGGTIIGAEAFLTGCKTDTRTTAPWSANDIAILEEAAETILPATDSSPGAKDVMIGEFIKKMVTDCYYEMDKKVFMEGIGLLNEASKGMFEKDFLRLTADEKHKLLRTLDTEAKEHASKKKDSDPAHYYTMMKQLTLLGFLTSEAVITKVFRYAPLPGKYEGCISYAPGEKAWS